MMMYEKAREHNDMDTEGTERNTASDWKLLFHHAMRRRLETTCSRLAANAELYQRQYASTRQEYLKLKARKNEETELLKQQQQRAATSTSSSFLQSDMSQIGWLPMAIRNSVNQRSPVKYAVTTTTTTTTTTTKAAVVASVRLHRVEYRMSLLRTQLSAILSELKLTMRKLDHFE
jgi:hypothetical protein